MGMCLVSASDTVISPRVEVVPGMVYQFGEKEFRIYTHAKLSIYTPEAEEVLGLIDNPSRIRLLHMGRADEDEYSVTAPTGMITERIGDFLESAIDWKLALDIAISNWNGSRCEPIINVVPDEDLSSNISKDGTFVVVVDSSKAVNGFRENSTGLAIRLGFKIMPMIAKAYFLASGREYDDRMSFKETHDIVCDVIAGYLCYLVGATDKDRDNAYDNYLGRIKASWLKGFSPTFEQVFG